MPLNGPQCQTCSEDRLTCVVAAFGPFKEIVLAKELLLLVRGYSRCLSVMLGIVKKWSSLIISLLTPV